MNKDFLIFQTYIIFILVIYRTENPEKIAVNWLNRIIY